MKKRAPFVGRDKELEAATQALKLRATDGLFVAGDSGVGKSRFIEEVCWTASLEGYEIMRVAATDGGADIPFGAFAHLLEGDSTTEEGSGSTPQTAKRLLQLAAGRRLVLVVDDAHFLDDPSAALVHKLVRGPRVFALLSITNRARTPQPILTLWKDDLIDRLELGALRREDLRRLVRARLGADIDGLTERSLWEATGGNLALHQELVTAGLETGNLRKTNDVWSWHGPPAVTSRLTEITAARLGCLEDEQRSALELLAIAAPIDLNDIDGLVPYQVVEDLEARRILNVEHACGRSVVRFRYPLEGQVFGAGIPKLRARRYRLDLARQIERAGSRDPGVLSRIACWRLDSHQRQPADTLVSATSDAWGALQAPLVRRLGPAALQAGAGHQVTRHLVEALLLAGPAWEVESALEELQPILDGDQLAMVDLDRALNALIGQDDLPCAAGLLRQAGAVVASPAAKSELQSLQALSYAFGGSNRECLTLTEHLPTAPTSPSRAQAVEGLARALCLTAMDRLDAAASVLDQSSLTAARGRHAGPLFEWIAELVRGIVLTLDGRLPDAAEQAAGAYRRAVQSEMDFAVALACALQSLVARTRGAAEQALRRAREGLTLARRSGARLALNMLLTEVACNALLLGDLPTASSAIDELDMGGKGVPTDCSAVRWQISVARAWLLWEQGDRHAAVQSMLDYSSRARSVEAWALEAAALHHALRMGSRGATVDRLRELAATGGTATRLFAEHAMALDDGQAIEAVSISFERAGYVLYAAEASARASDLYHAEGRLARSSRAAARAKRLMDLCRGVKTPGLASIRTPDLTERESEIASLAMQALPNREIAHRLVLSVRTVENHLQRVYAKTGATARTELEALVGPFVCEPAMARVPSSPGSLGPRADGTKVRAS